MNLLWKLLITGASLWVAIWLVPGLDFEGSPWLYLGVTVLVILANAIVKPILNLFSAPLIVLTLGLFLLVTNALVLQLVVWLSEDVFELGLTSDGFFWSTFLGAVVVSVVSLILEKVFPE
jgi:putative membrane protein